MTPIQETRSRPTAADAMARLERAWERSDAILGLPRPDALSLRPIELRHPTIFYVGHLPAFARNMMMKGVLGRPPLHPRFDAFFDFGIDPEEGEQETRAAWPDLVEVLAYRDRVRDEIRGAVGELAQRAGDDVLARGGRVLHLIREHEEMHHETLLYMFQELGSEHMRRPSWWSEPVLGEASAAPRAVQVPSGSIELGASFDDVDFGWDNEFPARFVHVDAFELDDLPVTVGEFREFVAAGGYEQPELWDAEGFAWARRHELSHPKDWVERAGTWFVRTVFEHVPLDHVTGWPACVSLAEARAYARWRGHRLPTEPELVRAAHAVLDADGTPRDERRAFPWGDAPPGGEHGNFGFRHTSPTPVGAYPAGASALGVQELVGNGWEWTETPFASHEGFRNYLESYPGYSRDFFDGKHFVMRGGSWATADGLLRRSFRNWFRFNYPFPFTKFRLARNA